MKPIVVYVESENDGKVTMTRDKFEEYLREAYTQGKSDGNVIISNPTYPSFPTFPCVPTVIYSTTTSEVTC